MIFFAVGNIIVWKLNFTVSMIQLRHSLLDLINISIKGGFFVLIYTVWISPGLLSGLHPSIILNKFRSQGRPKMCLLLSLWTTQFTLLGTSKIVKNYNIFVYLNRVFRTIALLLFLYL